METESRIVKQHVLDKIGPRSFVAQTPDRLPFSKGRPSHAPFPNVGDWYQVIRGGSEWDSAWAAVLVIAATSIRHARPHPRGVSRLCRGQVRGGGVEGDSETSRLLGRALTFRAWKEGWDARVGVRACPKSVLHRTCHHSNHGSIVSQQPWQYCVRTS